jgi:hypothetical protein
VIKGKINGGKKVRGRRGGRRRNLLDIFKERTGYSHLKEEALDRTMWRAGFGRGSGSVVRKTAELIKVPTRQQSVKINFPYRNLRVSLCSHKHLKFLSKSSSLFFAIKTVMVAHE